jgi:hypothetical protein
LAPFNPSPKPTQDPEWLKQSQPITQPKANTTMGEIFQGIGEIGGQLVAGTDFLIKKNIEDVATTKATQIRDAFTQQLDTLSDAVSGTGTNPAPAKPSLLADPTSVAGAPENLVPQGLQNIGDKVGVLVGARDNGRISETAYYGQLSTLAKSLRNWYPGYRDYIDQQISKVSGVDPANAYIRSRIADINAMSKQEDDGTKLILSTLKGEAFLGNPEAAILANDLTNGRITVENARVKMHSLASEFYQYKVQNARWQNMKVVTEMDEKIADQQMNEMGLNIAARAFNVPNIPGIRTPGGVLDLMEKSSRGEVEVDGPQWQVIDQYVRGRRALAANEMLNRANENGQVKLFGMTKVKEKINASLFAFDNVLEAIKTKNPGFANLQAASVDAMKDAVTYNLVTREDIGKVGLRWNAFRGLMGNEAFSALSQRLVVESGGLKAASIYMQKKATDALSPYDVLKQPSIKTDLEETARKARENPASGLGDGQVGNAFINLIETVGGQGTTKIPDEQKKNVVNYAFGEQNRGVATVIGPERIVDGKRKPADLTYFRRVTSPEITNEIWRLNQKFPNENLWGKYENWAKETFGFEIFSRQLGDLRDLTLRPDQTLAFNGTRFQVLDQHGNDLLESRAVAGYTKLSPRIRDTLRDINAGMHQLVPIAEKSGSPVDAYLMRVLSEFGYKFDPAPRRKSDGTKPSTEDIANIPTMIGNSLVTFYGATKKAAGDEMARDADFAGRFGGSAAFKSDAAGFLFNRVPAHQFAPEEAPASLESWLANPNKNRGYVKSSPVSDMTNPSFSSKPGSLNATGNLSDEPLLGMGVTNIPKGTNPKDVIKRLQGK